MKLQQGARGKCAFSAVSNFHLIILEFAHANAYNALEIVQKQEEVSVGLAAYLVLMLYSRKLAQKEITPGPLSGSRVTQFINKLRFLCPPCAAACAGHQIPRYHDV